MDNVENKTAIVTGGGSGIGYAIIEELLRKGAKKIAIIDLPIERSYNATVTLQQQFGKERVIFFPMDITNMEVYGETFQQIVKALNGLDILVNNAGICHERCLELTFAINTVALIRGSLLGLDYMGKHKGGKGGTIVNIASTAGIAPFTVCPIYCSSKHAVIGFSLVLEKFYDKTGVRILTICPKYTVTPLFVENNPFLDIVDKDFMENNIDKDVRNAQSAAHVGQSTVTVIRKGKNGSFWVVKNSEPPYSIEIQSHNV